MISDTRSAVAKFLADLCGLIDDPRPQQVTADIMFDPYEAADAFLEALSTQLPGEPVGWGPVDRVCQQAEHLLDLVHQPNPTDPSRWDIAPGKHRLFSNLIPALKEDLARLRASPPVPVGGEVKVKALEWGGDAREGFWRAETGFAGWSYYLEEQLECDGSYGLTLPGGIMAVYASRSLAVGAAQAHFDATIRSALLPVSPVPLDAGLVERLPVLNTTVEELTRLRNEAERTGELKLSAKFAVMLIDYARECQALALRQPATQPPLPVSPDKRESEPPFGYVSKADFAKIRDYNPALSGVVSGMVVNFEGHEFVPLYARPVDRTPDNRIGELERALWLFREFVFVNATRWQLGAGDHHHPMWALLSEVLARTDSPTGEEYRFIQPQNREPLALRSPSAAPAVEAPTHRHKKRGSTYTLIGIGKMQSEFWLQLNPSANWAGRRLILVTDGTRAEGVDMREVAIYRSTDDGSLWVRPKEEFEDGRFEPLSPSQQGGEKP